MKVDKYDRQIRLWGAEGQRRLGQAKVALLGCSPAGIEALKNLILPGVGTIDIWDDQKVVQSDLASSFFYAPEDIGKTRAQAASSNLLEMNPDVKGSAIVEAPCTLLKQPEKLKSYDLLVVGDLLLSEQAEVSRVCWQYNIAAVFITVVGFYIYVRSQRKVHMVEFERTAAKKYYLRLDNPFPALQEHSQKWNIPQLMENLDKTKDQAEKHKLQHELQGVPYPIILMQAYQLLGQGNRHKDQIVQQIDKWIVRLPEGERENFNQAKSRFLDLKQTPENFLRDFSRFENKWVQEAGPDSQPVLIFLRTCGQLLKRTNHLPQPVDLPDMETQTNIYIELKQVYKKQHQLDLTAMEDIMHQWYGKVPIPRNLLSVLVNNIEVVEVMEFDPYFKELEKIENPVLEWVEPEWRQILLAIRTWQQFQEKEGRAPTVADLEVVKSRAENLCKQFGFQKIQDERYIKEACRVSGQSIASIFSIAGAVGGQESIKLIARCFIPVKNGFVFSGVHSKGFSVNLF